MSSRGIAWIFILATLLMSGCSRTNENEMIEGYYTAEAADFDTFGWKESVTIFVSNNRIVTCEFDAKNPSGLSKSWDMEYMRVMDSICGNYPNKFARAYSVSLINKQNPENVDAIAGATRSYENFQLLAQAAIEQAKAGSKSVVYVELPE